MTIAPRIAAIECAHCSLPVPERSVPIDGRHFCCAGCEAVWHALHACGLERYYELQRAAGSRANRPGPAAAHGYMDHAEFQGRHVAPVAPDLLRVELRLDGLKCGACLWLLEALPRLESGLSSARVDLGRGVIALEWQPSRTVLSRLAARVDALGYQVRPLGTLASRQEWRRQDRRWLVDIGVAGAISGNVMAVAFALYGAQFAWMDDATRQFLQWTSVALAALAVCWPGRIYLRNAWSALRTRTPHMDLPIALALLAGLGGGVAATIQGRSGVYFESVSMLVFLLLVGRFVQFRQQRRARHEIELLCALVPQTARRIAPDGTIEVVPSEALRVGDRIHVPAGEALPADGVVEVEQAYLSMQMLTGESRPLRVCMGDQTFAGVCAIGTPVRLRVTAAGNQTRAAAIARMVDEAAGRRPPIVEFANRIAGWFLLVVVLAATAAGVAWWFIDPARVAPVVVAMLVVTCPCALGLATPLTMVAALGKAARAGILIRGGEVLERLAGTGTLVLDKTGTVTEGSMRVLRERGAPQAIALAAALEKQSAHPIGRAIAHHAAVCAGVSAGVPAGVTVSEVQESAGHGISGRVDGRRVAVGNAAFVASMMHGDDAHWRNMHCEAQEMVGDGLTPVFIGVDGTECALVGLGDPLRAEAPALVAGLQARGWKVWLASGDLPALAARVGAAIGVPEACIRGGCTPEAKMELVGGLHDAPMVMVGDGVNDLPAMAAASVGVAVRQGAQATIARADVALSGGGLAQVTELLDGARRTMRTVHLNFAISIAYNLIGGALAATGQISPLIAAILMPLSGLTVTAVALRMPRFNPPRGGA